MQNEKKSAPPEDDALFFSSVGAATLRGSFEKLRSANRAAREQVDDCQQDHSAQQRDQQRAKAEVAGHDVAAADKRVEQEAGNYSANDTYDNIEKNALLSVTAHDDAGEPADDATYDDCENERHGRVPLRL